MAAQRRAEARRARIDTRDWARARRERTRHLIALGGLFQKAGLVDLTNDDRAVLLGALLDVAGALTNDRPGARSREDILARWRQRGRAAFKADEAASRAETTKNDG